MACTEVEYGVATDPSGNTLGTNWRGGGAAMVIESGEEVDADCGGIAESTTCSENWEMLAVVGVPVI